MARAALKERAGPSGEKPAGRSSPEGLGFYSYRVRDVMTRKVVSVAPGATLAIAAGIMSRRSVSGLPVVDAKGRVVGVLSQKDILRLLHDTSGLRLPRSVFDLILSVGRGHGSGVPEISRRVLESAKVRSSMTRPAIYIGPGASLDDAVRTLISRRINRLPVVADGALVGIVTRHDLLSGLTPEEPVET